MKIINKEFKEKPLKKGTCPMCLSKMDKTKKGWLCIKCGTRVDYK